MKKTSKYLIGILSFTLFFTSFSPIASTVSAERLENKKILDNTFENEDVVSASLVNKVTQKNYHVNSSQTKGWGSVGRILIKKFGKRYATQVLPKKIYSKMPKFVKKKISQKSFVAGWSTYVLLSPLDEMKSGVSQFLQKKGVPRMIANSAGYIAQGMVWAII